MELAQYIEGYECSRAGCGAVFKEETHSCSVCGSSELRPFYNYYQLLGLGEEYSDSQLASAYRKLSLKYHPDVNKNGQEAFIVISEAYQVLKDQDKAADYSRRLQAIQRGESAQARTYTFGHAPGFEQQGTYYRQFTQEDFENIFRQFHNFTRPEYNLARASQITGFLGAILGFLAGGLLSFGVLSVPGALFGYLIGRAMPVLGPLLLKMTNYGVVLAGFIGGTLFLLQGNFIALAGVIFACYFYFALSRSWARELFPQ